MHRSSIFVQHLAYCHFFCMVWWIYCRW